MRRRILLLGKRLEARISKALRAFQGREKEKERSRLAVGFLATSALIPLAPILFVSIWILRPLPSPASLGSWQKVWTDRHGAVVWEELGPDDTRMAKGGGVPPDLVTRALLAAEDHRFFRHPGVDPVGLVRALAADVRALGIRQGGSTLTMQLAGLLHPRGRSVPGKFAEILDALRLELWWGKRTILSEYARRAPFGQRMRGFESAARGLLGKDLSALSAGEAALLAAIPGAPTRLSPFRHPEELRARRDRILTRMRSLGSIPAEVEEAAKAEWPSFRRVEARNAASHLLRRVAEIDEETGRTVSSTALTLDLAWQGLAERLLKAQVERLSERNVNGGCVVILDNPTGDVLAWVGSPGEEFPGGAIDALTSLRQPGSSLKPFLVWQALQAGHVTSEVLPDVPTAFPDRRGVYLPKNYGLRHWGPVRLRDALASSLNLPMVHLVSELGPARFQEFLLGLGFADLKEESDHYGLGLALGNAEVRPWQLAQAFRTLANGGRASSLRFRKNDPAPRFTKVADEDCARLVANLLSDDEARALGFGRHSAVAFGVPSAVKTGTSQAFRDNWCSAFCDQVTVLAWLGNADRSPMRGVSGVSGSAPLVRDLFREIASRRALTLSREPRRFEKAALCALSGMRPGPRCPQKIDEIFLPGTAPRKACDWHRSEGLVLPSAYRDWLWQGGALASGERVRVEAAPRLRVRFPESGESFAIPRGAPEGSARIWLRAEGEGELRWLLDGAEIGRTVGNHRLLWVLKEGDHELRVVKGNQRSSPVWFSVEG